jgi:serine protease AprX
MIMHKTAEARPTRTRLFIMILVLLPILGALAAPSALAANRPLLRLHRGTFDARSSRHPSVHAALSAGDPSLAIIQFGAPIAPADRAALQQTGVELLEYLPDYAYLVRGNVAQLDLAARLGGVYARAPFLDADKLAPALLRALAENAFDRPIPMTIQSWPGQELELAAGLAALGIDPRRPLDAAQLLRIAGLRSLRWAEPAIEIRLLNDKARAIMGVPAVWRDYGIYGKGQILGVADSGLDTGDPATLSPDFAGRIVATHVLSPGGDIADQFGHGTHVAGSASGAGVQSGADPALQRYEGSFAGVAPEASLVIQAFETSPEGAVLGLGDDPSPVFAQAYADGARIHTNSWGGPTGNFSLLDPSQLFGRYPEMSRLTDEFMWEHPDMAIFFAAGNNGNDGLYFIVQCLPGFLQDGVIDPDSINAPGTAKNVITVGASESERSDAFGSSKTWGESNETCFREEPLASDTLSDDATGMAAFSSRGPTDDGRIKPDLVAPGTNIFSNRTHMPGANTLWDPEGTNPDYLFSGGTSMATPLAAGAGVLVREWLTRRGLVNPSAAAVKATLLNTTKDIAPGQYGTGEKQEIPFTRPNSVVGWGRLDLGFIAAPAPYQLWLDDHTTGLATGQTLRYTNTISQPLVVSNGDQPLRVMLAWTDPPASLSSGKQLVNDLDLLVTGPDGQIYWGNGAASGDHVNNVEGIIIPNPAPGAYTVEVRAHNVPVDTQPYALVVGGAITSTMPLATATPTATKTSTPTATKTSTPTVMPAPSATPGSAPPERKIYLSITVRG